MTEREFLTPSETNQERELARLTSFTDEELVDFLKTPITVEGVGEELSRRLAEQGLTWDRLEDLGRVEIWIRPLEPEDL